MKTSKYIYITILAGIIALTGCTDEYYYLEGSGEIITETLELDPFTAISMEGLDDVDISWGEEQKVTVTGDANIISRIMTDVNNGTWKIRLQHGHYRNYNLKYYITVPQINSISNRGLARVVVNDFVNNGDLDVKLEGAGTIELNRMENTENLYIQIEGLGKVEGFGEFTSLENLDIIITGSGKFLGYPVLAENCYIDICGAAKCDVSVSDYLDVIIEGTGIVNYKGQPTISHWITGLGSVISKN